MFETHDQITDDDPEPIIAQPLYADGHTAIEDLADDDTLKSTQDTPIVFVPDDEIEQQPRVEVREPENGDGSNQSGGNGRPRQIE